MTSRQTAKGKEHRRLEVSIQVRGGQHPGLGSGWRAGELVLDERPVRFVPMRGGVRFLRGRPLDIELSNVRRSARKTPARAAWRVTPGLPILEVCTPSGQLDIAVPVGLDDWVIDALGAV